METSQTEHMNKTNDINTLIHMSAAGLLVFMIQGLIDGSYVYNWTAVVSTALLFSILGHSIFRRKTAINIQNAKMWKTSNARWYAYSYSRRNPEGVKGRYRPCTGPNIELCRYAHV
ncbi:MAG: hypothetical protein ACI808_002604 [Paraglaciecola sp.]|jgi:hypothetical protein